jgi:hypothetical protein
MGKTTNSVWDGIVETEQTTFPIRILKLEVSPSLANIEHSW